MKFRAVCVLILWGELCFAATSTVQIKSSNSQNADLYPSRSIGHLVSSNNQLVPPGEVAIGTLYAAVGISRYWSLGTSPFAYLNFQMNNFMSRWAMNLKDGQRVGFELDYFKSFGRTSHADQAWTDYCSQGGNDCRKSKYPYGFSSFKMEAWAGKLTYSFAPNPKHRTSVTNSLYYYIDDDRPFSLRMDPQNGDHYAENVTVLHEIALHDQVFLALEGGVWGLNYQYPYLHSGATIEVQSSDKRLFVGLGASSTFSPWFPKEKAKEFMAYDSRASYHPELQIQYFF